MGVWSKMLANWEVITADIPERNVPADHIKWLDINKQALQNGTSAPSWANILTTLGAYMRMKLGGNQIVNLRLDDLVALNAKWLQRALNHIGQLGGGDNYHAGLLEALRLPLFIDKMGPRGMRELSGTFPYVAQTNCDNVNYSIKYTYRDSPFIERRSLHYAYETFLGTGSAQTRINISRVGAELVGILIFCTNDGLGAAEDPEVSEFKLICDDREVHHDNWKTRGDERSPVNSLDDATYLGLWMANYWFISFEEEPWPADNLWALCLNTNYAGGTAKAEAFRLICIYREP